MCIARDNEILILPVGVRDHLQGSLNAPIVLVEYGDYQCPSSGQAYKMVKEIQRQLGQRLCFAFRHFPQTQMHPCAQNAAEAAQVAAAQGKFWQMHDLLFEHQQDLKDADLVEYAIRLGLDICQFLQDMSEDVYANRVNEDIESGLRSGVTSTPTFFINSVRYAGAANVEQLLSAIAAVDFVDGGG